MEKEPWGCRVESGLQTGSRTEQEVGLEVGLELAMIIKKRVWSPTADSAGTS